MSKLLLAFLGFIFCLSAFAAEIKIGTRVIDQSNAIGEVTELIDGKYGKKARYDLGGYTREASIENLKAEVTEHEGLSKGKVVIDLNNSIGTVTYVFEDGRTQYDLGGYFRMHSIIRVIRKSRRR